MHHRATIGMTMSGKTWSAIKTALALIARGRGVLVLHKPGEVWPLPPGPLVFQTDHPEEFLRMFWAARNCDCFMELADAAVDKFDGRFHDCFSKGRHLGHRCHYLTQYGTSVHPRIRGNCVSLCLFAVNRDTAKLWAAEFNDDALLGASALPPHVFYYKENKFTPARLLKLSA